MISEGEARIRILESLSPLPVENVRLSDARDRFSAQEIRATVALPPFDNSAMDGYAVMASDAQRGARLKIVGEQPAGPSRQLRISSGEAVRIFTGAPVPMGANAVVVQEEARELGELVVIETDAVSPGDFVRTAGSDLAAGQKILEAGRRLRPATLALLASQGLGTVQVHARASVAIITTGDEVREAGKELEPGEIYESNGLLLETLAAGAGAMIKIRRHCRDDLQELCAALDEALRADALIISGGVSVGARDLVREALRELGVKLELWRVSIKPGKPFLFGRHGRCAVFGLPGNPVSSFITFLVFARPALLRMMGAAAEELELPKAVARVEHDVVGDEVRPHYLRGRLSDGRFAVIGRQESHALFGLARANALLRLGRGEKLPAGSEVVVSLIH